MVIYSTIYLGAFVRWLLKGCKTNLRDELNGNLSPKILNSYDTESYIIGLITAVIVIGIALLFFIPRFNSYHNGSHRNLGF